MSKYNNRHLNIFHHYYQNGSIPIENNISRGLAIVLQEYPALFLLFLEKIEKQISQKDIFSVADAYTVNFQKKISQFESFENVVGVSLTGKDLPEPLDDNDVLNSKKDPITDISIEYGDTAIIIEVKRTEEDCRNQLQEQVKKLRAQISEDSSRNDEKIKINDYYASLSWTSIIELLERYLVINPKSERLIQDYYEHICDCFPSWRPIRKLNDINEYDEISQSKRLNVLISEYANDKKLNSTDYIELDFDWASKLCFWSQKENVSIINGNQNNIRTAFINFAIWPSNKSSQYYALKSISDFTFLDGKQKIQTKDLKNSITICLSVVPFIKVFANFGDQIYRIDFNESTIQNKNSYVSICESIKGRWKKDNWNDFFSIISGFEGISKGKVSSFKAFLDSGNRTCFNVVLSCEIVGRINYSDAQRIDKDDEFLDLFDCIINELKKIIANNKESP